MKRTNLMAILPSYAGGGAERVIIKFLESLGNAEINSKLFVANANGPLKDKLVAQAIEFRYSHFIFCVFTLLSEIKKNKIDVLISTFPNSSLIVLFLRIIGLHKCKIIVRQPNMVEVSLSRTVKLKVLKYLYKKIIYKTDVLIVTSEEMKREGIANNVKKEKIKLLRNSVDYISLRKRCLPKRDSSKGIKLIFVGRLVFQKGLDRILPTIKKINNLHLTIIGDGEEKRELEKITKRLKIEKRIKFLGYLESPYDFIAGADYSILPSRWEGLPNSGLESLSLGTPVIAFSDIVAFKDYKKNIADGSIIIVNNQEQLHKTLKNLSPRRDCNKPKLRKNLLNFKVSPKQYKSKLKKIILNVSH